MVDKTVNSRESGPGTWQNSSSAFSLGSQTPKPKPTLQWRSFHRFLSCRHYCSSLPALGETFNSQITATAAETLLHSQACGPRKHQALGCSPAYIPLCVSDPHFIFLIFSCYILSLTAMHLEQQNGQNMNFTAPSWQYFSGQGKGILADRFKETIKWPWVDRQFFSWRFWSWAKWNILKWRRVKGGFI